ncbi:MAG: valine--tRNA ligase [Candidatus Micrarchaeota archaeon]
MLGKYDKETEKKWQKYWNDNKIHQFNLDAKGKIYSIDTPPPFTSGELHMGHVLSYSYFDFVARYKRMHGFNVYYPQGWDTQGFPTETKVEKKYGRLPSKEFRERCVEWTHEMIAKMKEQMNDMGWSPDWRYEYKTMDPEYHKKVQLSLIQMYKDKLVYRNEYPVYWCTKCMSAIAKAELDDVERDGMLNHIKFTGPKGEDLLIATTRPELMNACVALLYNPEDKRYVHLKGKKAKTALGKEVPILEDKDVEKEFGTGLLMVCTFGDKMDVVWMHRHHLPIVNAIGHNGKMINSGEFDGIKTEEAKKKTIEKLKAEGKITKQEPLKQTVKVHDRCRTAIELLTSMQWFADIRTTGKKIKELAHQIEWVPNFGINYLIDWVEGAEWDWVISRQRVFGTPLPFYYCEKCTKTEPAEELPFYPEKAKEMKCCCGEVMKAETSTCDCWVDSSITPLVISGWPDNKKMFDKVYPVSLRPQGVEIVRTWAFYTIYRSGFLTGKAPFKKILLNGNVLAPDGKKMSKSLGNIISPATLQFEYPVDAIRQWAAMSGAMAKDRPFSYEDIRYAKSFLNKVWNAAKFVESSTSDFDGKKVHLKRKVDIWIISRMNQAIKEVTEAMEKFEFHLAASAIQKFFWNEFCDHYLEYIKYRTYNNIDKQEAQYCLRYVLENTVKILAPISPHICEEIYSELFEKKSLQTIRWPEYGEINSEVIGQVERLKEAVSFVRQYKSKKQLSQASELNEVTVADLDNELIEELKAISKVNKVKKGSELKA